MLYTHMSSFHPQSNPNEESIVAVPILQMRKRRPREIQYLTQAYLKLGSGRAGIKTHTS